MRPRVTHWPTVTPQGSKPLRVSAWEWGELCPPGQDGHSGSCMCVSVGCQVPHEEGLGMVATPPWQRRGNRSGAHEPRRWRVRCRLRMSRTHQALREGFTSSSVYVGLGPAGDSVL